MAAKRRPGLRHQFGDELDIQIGPDIRIVVCREAGQIVTYLKSPPEQTVIKNRKSTCKKIRSSDNSK